MLQKRLPNLRALRVFEAAARRKSFVAAATELHVTHGAISKQIQALEYELATQLFERRNRGIHLTRQGQWLAERLSKAFYDLENTLEEFYSLDAKTNTLTVSCEPTLCLRFLIPAMADLKRDTGIDIRVLAAGGPIDFRQERVSVAIRRGDFTVPADIRATVLADEWMGPVIAPQSVTSDRAILSRLHSRTRPNAWSDWKRATGYNLQGIDIDYEHFFLAIQAAEAGHGMALASVHMVTNELLAGRLVAPHGFVPDGSKYYALRPASAEGPQIEAFLEWLRIRMDRHVVDAKVRE